MQKLLNGFFILFLSFSATAEQANEKNADLYAAIKAFDHAYATNEVEKYFSLYADDATMRRCDGVFWRRSSRHCRLSHHVD